MPGPKTPAPPLPPTSATAPLPLVPGPVPAPIPDIFQQNAIDVANNAVASALAQADEAVRAALDPICQIPSTPSWE